MAKWVPPLIHTPKRKDYPLQLLVSRHRLFMQTQFSDFPDLRAIAGDEPWMQINPVDAVPRGIKDSDVVEVLNDRGKLKVKTFLCGTIPPGIVQMWLGYKAGEYIEGAPTLLQVPCGTSETFDDAARQWLEVVQKRWCPLPGQKPSWERWPLTMNGQFFIAGNWDVIWDNYCEVRKVSGGK
jgi:hypothetical protein